MRHITRFDLTRRGFLAAAASHGLIASGLASAQAIELAPKDKQGPGLKVPPPLGKKVGWALVGIGRLTLGQLMPAFAEAEQSRAAALVSGHPDKAQATAARYGVDPKAIYNYENYDALKNNDDVQAVYVVLPNSMHAEYTIRALEAGKHVLCEKPMCVTVDEAKKMIDAAKAAKRKLMIAYRLRHEPYNKAAIELAKSKKLGKVKLITANNVQNTRPPNIRLSKELGGGPLGDVGVYCLNATRYLTGEEPSEFTATIVQPKDEPRFAEVPESVLWTQRFPSGVVAECACSFGMTGSKFYRVMCENGWFGLENAYGYQGQRMLVSDGDGLREVTFPRVNHFAKQMDHFSECILGDKDPITPGEDGLADQKAVALIEEAGHGGKTTRAT
jgi:predicted dehydrogenase